MLLTRILKIERCLIFVSVVALTIGLQACGTTPTQDAVGKFAKAMDITADSVEAGFSLVNANAVRLGKQKNNLAYLEGGMPKLTLPKPFLETKDLVARLVVIRGLGQYAKTLTAISNTNARDRIQAASGSIADSLVSIDSTLAGFDSQPIPLPERDQIANALNAVGQFLIDRKIGKELPPIIEKMHPNIEKTVFLLKTDIGDIKRDPKPKESGICGQDSNGDPRNGCGLRRALQLEVESWQSATESILALYIQRGDNTISGLDTRRRAFEQATEVTARAYMQDIALAAVPKALDNLVNAHSALRQPKEQSTLVQIEAFLQQAENLAPLFKLAFGG